MASFHKLDDGEMTQFKTRLGLAGMTAEMAREALRDHSRFNAMVRGFDDKFPPLPRANLIQKVFTLPKPMIKLAAQAREICGWGEFKDADFQRLEREIPEWPQGEDWPLSRDLPGLSLRIRLAPKDGMSGIKRTCEAHRQLIRFGHLLRQNKFLCGENFLSGPKNLRLLANEPHRPVIEWCQIRFGANAGQKPIDVRTALRSPADELLAAAWLHPSLVEQMGVRVNYCWLAGYEATVPGSDHWEGVPCLSFDQFNREVKLGVDHCNIASGSWSVPAFCS